MSVHPIVRRLSYFAQGGIGEYIFNAIYRWLIGFRLGILHRQMLTILDQSYHLPKTVLIVATHFGLAHKLSMLKPYLEKERKVKIFLVVQVTDDSPQSIWYVEGADIIFVPSETTKRKLLAHGRNFKKKRVRFEVNPYPLSPVLAEHLSDEDQEHRLKQFDNESPSWIHTIIPISGAAVGMGYFKKVIDTLHKMDERFVFHLVAKRALYTRMFLRRLKKRSYVHLYTSTHDKNVVDMYEDAYKHNIISLEITKPSEQAFKALFDCEKRGASLLLLSEPVGKQEEDNLDFLERHGLIPTAPEQKTLFSHAKKNTVLIGASREEILKKASLWRGIRLPRRPKPTAEFILWCKREGILSSMALCKIKPRQDKHALELSSNGVELFWKRVADLLA